MAPKNRKLSFTAPHAGRRSLKARKGGRKAHLFGADLSEYSEMDLENLTKTARLVLCDVGLHQAGAISWDYKGQTPAAAQQQMEAVLTMVAAEEKRRRRSRASHEHIQRPDADCEDEDILRGSR